MSSAAQSRGLRKGMRDALQAVVAIVAAGGATAVIDMIVDNLNPAYGVLLAFVFKVVIAYAQNFLETAGRIPVLLPTPGLVPSVGEGAAVAVGTVDAVAEKVGDTVGEVSGTVQSVTGELLGEVVDVDRREE
jgi:hypothetical protein